MGDQPVTNTCNEGDLLAEAEDLPCLRHACPQLAESSHHIAVVGPFSGQCREHSHQEVLDNSADLVTAHARIYNVSDLLENLNDGVQW